MNLKNIPDFFLKVFERDKYLYLLSRFTFEEKKYDPMYFHKSYCNNNYFSNDVRENRKKFVEKFDNLENCFEYGCGPIPLDKKKLNGYYDPFVPEFSYFDIDKYKFANTLLIFDVLEHLIDLRNILRSIPFKQLITTIPIVPDEIFKDFSKLKTWKHYKPDEHIWYFTKLGFEEMIESCGWYIFEMTENCECPPRSDVFSYCLRRK